MKRNKIIFGKYNWLNKLFALEITQGTAHTKWFHIDEPMVNSQLHAGIKTIVIYGIQNVKDIDYVTERLQCIRFSDQREDVIYPSLIILIDSSVKYDEVKLSGLTKLYYSIYETKGITESMEVFGKYLIMAIKLLAIIALLMWLCSCLDPHSQKRIIYLQSIYH
jgi:hypothetical protein